MRTALTSLRARWWLAVEHHPQALIGGLLLLSAPLVLWLAWLLSARWEQVQVRAELAHADKLLGERQQQAVGDLELAISHFKDLPALLATESRLIRLLEHPGDAAGVRAASQYLKDMARYMQVDLAWLTDRRGLTLAANNHDTPGSLVGQILNDRLYFTEAVAGRPGHQFAVGRLTSIPGLFFSAPVRSASGHILGVVAVKINLLKVANHIRTQGLFVTDEQGVVILSERKELLFHAVPDAPILQAERDIRQKRYQRTDFPVLRLVPADADRYPGMRLLGAQGIPVLHRMLAIPDDGLALHLLVELDQLSNWRTQRAARSRLSALAALAVLWAVAATGVFVLRSRLYRHHIEAANAELRVLNDRLKQQAETDFLTGCMNRRRFDEELEQEIGRSRRQRYPLTLALIDLDHFKRLNDSYGHQTGDAALQHFANVVRGHIRQTDRFARIGGEEFALLMPDTGSAAAKPLSERLRKVIAATPLPREEGASLTITASIGLASMCPQDGRDSLFLRADNAMYEAKSTGRNRVVQAACPQGQSELPQAADPPASI